MKMTGNTILITGGNGGIGRGLAEAFLAKGNEVIITGRDKAKLQAAVDANPGLHAMELDVENPDAIKASKRIFNMMQDATDAELLQAESDEQDKIIRTPNQMEAVFAEMQKRKPAFTD